MQLVDIGANLSHDSFSGDLEDVIGRARATGVVGMVVTGSSVPVSQTAFALTQDHPGYLYATAGIHPHHAKDSDQQTPDALRDLLRRDSVVAVGECGLDYFRNFSSPHEQQDAFVLQLELAAESGLPVFLHQREAHDGFMEILKSYRDKISRGVAHCFTGSERELRDYLDLDLHIGITGWICDERRGHHLRELIALIPEDRLMLETDAPYLLPRDLKPKPKSRRNEPCYLPHVLRTVADCSPWSMDKLAHQTRTTSQDFFGVEFAG